LRHYNQFLSNNNNNSNTTREEYTLDWSQSKVFLVTSDFDIYVCIYVCSV